MSTANAIETEVKIPVPQWAASDAESRFAAVGLKISAPRVFEANFVFDTPQQSVRGSRMLLRLRRVGDRTILTWKGPEIPGPHKSRPELEVDISSFETMQQILGHLGYQTYFRYEKYRTEFASASKSGSATFDETPIGNFIELEGTAAWIDETATRLGFRADDYVLDSYGRLYLAHCAKLGVQPLNMTFPFTS
jgi:adenylate cyclase class 2